MAAKASMPVAVLATVVDSLKQQVYSAVDVYCTEALQTSSDLSGDGCDEFTSRNGLETAIVTLSTMLHQLKDKGNAASTDSTQAKLSSTASSLNSSTSSKEVATVSNETHNDLLSRINRLEQSMLEVVQKGEQMEQRQKVLDETSATKEELCDLQAQLTSRMCPLESSLKGLHTEVQSRFVQMSKDVGTNYNKRVQDLERIQLDTSDSVGQELNKFRCTIKELKDSMFSVETDVCLLKNKVSQVQEEISDSEEKVLQVGNRISQIELKTGVIEERLKKTEVTMKNQTRNLKTKTDLLTHLFEKKVNNLERLKVILNQLNDRTTERAALSTKVDLIEQNLSQLSQTVRKQAMSPPPIAFCASQVEGENITIKANQKLDNFSNFLCNAGYAFDASEGVFTAPQDGLYGFASWIEKERNDSSELVQVAIVHRHNTTGMEVRVAFLPIENQWGCNSITCIVNLETGDKVFLKVTHAHEGAELSWALTFAGWLIR